jgi:hypothetical protein
VLRHPFLLNLADARLAIVKAWATIVHRITVAIRRRADGVTAVQIGSLEVLLLTDGVRRTTWC